MNLELGSENVIDHTNIVFFTQDGFSYCSLQEDGDDGFTIVSVIDSRIIEMGPKSELVNALNRLDHSI